MKNKFYLVLSTFFLLIPLIIFFIKKNKNIYEIVLAIFFVINILLSISCWTIGIKKSYVHLCDGFFAKISIVLFSIYTLFIKEIDNFFKILYIIILIFTYVLFSKSTLHSLTEWCCTKHIMYHSIFHLLVSIGCIITFL